MFFVDNKIYIGSFDVYGGLGYSVEGNGSLGIIYFYYIGQGILNFFYMYVLYYVLKLDYF